ncbi:MAG TPA: PfkB family carbohydrate kinase, partial [Acidimicrobiales bacterium]|nr:PfkB family carbohydrate kinase [Acidimicrobiales bacterium]
MSVVVVGTANVDVVVPVDRLPGPGETAVGSGTVHFGGKGANQAVAAAALCADVDLVACVGDDAYGTAVVADLERAGVGTTHVRAVRGARTGTATVAVDPRGENLIVVDLGANALLDPDDAGAAVSRAAVTLVQLEVGDDVVDAAIRSSPGVVVLNPAPARALRADLLAHVDVVVPNRVELALLAGQEAGPRTPAQAAAMARALPGTFDVVVSMGADGAVVVERRANVAVHVVAPTVDAVDTTGAGDVLCGVLA